MLDNQGFTSTDRCRPFQATTNQPTAPRGDRMETKKTRVLPVLGICDEPDIRENQ
jgi:hypothetical protein